jgi:membrane protease YdiL (CAAX protease family)
LGYLKVRILKNNRNSCCIYLGRNLNQRKVIKNFKLISLIKSIGFIATYLLFGAVLSQIKYLFPLQFERYAQGILGTIGAIITVIIFLRIEKKTFKDYGLIWEKTSLKKFGLGLSLGIALAVAMMLSQILYSGLVITFNNDVNLVSFLPWSLAFIPLAFMEEIAFRSYPLIRLNKAFGLRQTQVILAILFAVYHMLMMWSPEASFLGPGIWALVYALTAVASNGIALPTGLHFGLNFVQSVLGGQKGIEPIWNLDYPQGISESSIAANETFGIGLHFSLLVLSVLATEMYIRSKRATINNVYNA